MPNKKQKQQMRVQNWNRARKDDKDAQEAAFGFEEQQIRKQLQEPEARGEGKIPFGAFEKMPVKFRKTVKMVERFGFTKQ